MGCRLSDRNSPPNPRAEPRAQMAKDSRYFTLRLSFLCIVEERGSAKIDRAPSARGPNSMRP